MFGKKKCSHCDRTVDKNFDFCPYCANPIGNPGDYGLLGKTDDLNELQKNFTGKSGLGANGSFFDKIFESAFKVIEKQIQKISEEELKAMKSQKAPRNMNGNFELYINGKRVNLPGNLAGVQVEEMQGLPGSNNFNQPKKAPKAKMPKVSDETLKQSIKLPRKEAKTKLTRTSEKVIYELDTPGIQSLNQVLINQLENSIEIRAYTSKAVFNKTLPVKLPLMQYSVNPEEGKLVLEFKAS